MFALGTLPLCAGAAFPGLQAVGRMGAPARGAQRKTAPRREPFVFQGTRGACPANIRTGSLTATGQIAIPTISARAGGDTGRQSMPRRDAANRFNAANTTGGRTTPAIT